MEAFQLTEGEKKQLLHFRDALIRLLQEAWRQARAKLMTIYRAVVEGTCKIEGKRLYAPDGTWMYINKPSFPPFIPIHGVSAETYFPDILRLPQERLELLQLGWRASDEGKVHIRPFMSTAQPWQLLAWAAVRHGELRIRIRAVVLTREGASIHMHIKAKSWEQKWSKDEAVSLVTEYLKYGEWAPLLTTWLGDGGVDRHQILRGNYRLMIFNKEPWRLSRASRPYTAFVTTGKEAFKRLVEAAGAYGRLLDVLRPHKWELAKLATDDAIKAAFKLRAKKLNKVVIAGVEMFLSLIYNGGALHARYYTRDPEKALETARRLETAGLRPNIVCSGPDCYVYITTADLLMLAKSDETIRKAVADYLTEKARNGTPQQRKIAIKLLQKYSTFFRLMIYAQPARPLPQRLGHKQALLETQTAPLCKAIIVSETVT
jgi:hypothetical protein